MSDRTSNIAVRGFLIGCPRSGSTLLQSMLASHESIASYPESHCFTNIWPTKLLRQWLKIATPAARPRFPIFLDRLDQSDLCRRLPTTTHRIPQYIRVFVQAMDAATLRQGKTIWVEKTPGHLRSIDLIERYVPRDVFIHMLRRGQDVVASLYETSRRYPQQWGNPWSVDKCIEKWNADVLHLRRHIDKPNHALVRYEELVTDPRRILLDLCEFLKVDFDEGMLTRRRATVDSLILQDEPWKNDAKGEVRKPSTRKFDRLFDAEERSCIAKRLAYSDDLLSLSASRRQMSVPRHE